MIRRFVVACALALFSSSCLTNPPTVPTAACGGEVRIALDCSSEFNYDAAVMKGGFTAFGLGALNAYSEQKALRDIDVETQRYVAQVRRLCDEYNKCVIDRETYANRSENLRRRLAQVPELYEQLRTAPDPSSQRFALSAAYMEMVPQERRRELNLKFTVLVKSPGQSNERAAGNGATLNTNSSVRFVVEVTKPAHIYLFQRSEQGKITVLYPDVRIGLLNPIPANRPVTLPPDGGAFRVDVHDLGVETVYIITSLEPIPGLQGDVSDRTSAALFDGLINMTHDQSCNPWGTSSGSSTQKPCSRERGLVLEPAPSSMDASVSMTVRTEAGDDLIAKKFTYRHIP